MTDLLSMKQVDSVNFPRMSEREVEARFFADKRAVAVIDEQRQVINDLIVQKDELRKLSVTNILLRVVPDEFGNGFEVYAKSVADVEAELTRLSTELEDWQLGIKQRAEISSACEIHLDAHNVGGRETLITDDMPPYWNVISGC